MAPTNRRRAPAAAAASGGSGRAIRRTRTGADSDDSFSSSGGPLPPIGEDVELAKPLSVTSTGTHVSESPERHLNSRKKGVRAREGAEEESEKKRRRAISLLEEIEAEVEKRCEDLMAEAAHKARDLHMELKVQLMFLPESVRKMPWKTFIDDFGGSLENVIQNVKEQDYRTYVAASPLKSAGKPVPTRAPASMNETNRSNSRLPPLPHATPAALNRRLLAFETPSFTPHGHSVPGTVLRTARKGETIYSIRGSPIVPDTVVKAPAGSLVATFEGISASPMTCITLDSETTLDLSNPDQLSEESRANAKAKIQALQAKLDALLMQFN